MKKNVVFLDDMIKDGDPFAETLREIVEECKSKLIVLNKKKDIDSFLDLNTEKAGMVLLDRDLAKIKPRIRPVEILEKLSDKKIPVFMLSHHDQTTKELEEDFRTLYSKGAIDYLMKSKVDSKTSEDREFLKNIIISAVTDLENNRFKLVIKCDTAEIIICERDSDSEMGRIDFSDIKRNWQSRQNIPASSGEIIMRMLYEMAKREDKSAAVGTIYILNPSDTVRLKNKEKDSLDNLLYKLEIYIKNESKEKINKQLLESINDLIHIENEKLRVADLSKLIGGLEGLSDDRVIQEYIDELLIFRSGKIQLPPKFADDLREFNIKVKNVSNGNIIGRLLSSTQGKRGGVYNARIGSVKLHNSCFDEDTPDKDWKEMIEKRLKALEDEVQRLKV